MASGKYDECRTCPLRNNKLACLLHECEIRDKHDKELFRKWHKEWAEKKLCFACEHCKHRDAWEHSSRTTEAYCELTGKVIFGEDTCGKWVEGEEDGE